MRTNQQNLDLLLGEPKRAIRTMAMAFIVAMAVMEINNFVDAFWVSGLGARSSSAVATVVPIYGLMMCAGLGVGVGVTTTVAFRLGRNDRDIANRLVGNALVLGVVLALLSSVIIALLARPAISMMGAAEIMDECIAYLIPYIALSPVLLCDSILGAALRAEGASQKSTIVQLSAAVFNMVIDPVLIYVLDLGVLGAGLSTVISTLLALCIGLYWYLRGRMIIRLERSAFRIDKSIMRELLEVGAPKTVQSTISNMTDLIQRVFIIVAGGTNAVTIYNYPWRYIGLVGLPGRACENAMVPVCASAYGQDDLDKMREGYLYTAKIVLLCGIVFAAILFVFAEQFMTVLTMEESMAVMRPDFVWALRVSVFLIPFSGLMGIGSSMLQAMKKSKISMNYYFLWAFVKLAMYAVSAYWFHSFEGIIYSMVLVHVFGGLCLVGLANREYRKIRKNLVEKSETV